MQGGAGQIVMLLMIVVVFYFFMIRPQQKKQKEQKNFRANLKKDDKVVTIGGIHGKIVDVEEATVVLNCEGSKIRFAKSAIAQSASEQLQA